MKKILFTLVLAFSLTNFVLAQKSNNTACQSGDNALARARIISREEMTVTGSFQFTLQVEAFENCTLDSIRIINDGTFFGFDN